MTLFYLHKTCTPRKGDSCFTTNLRSGCGVFVIMSAIFCKSREKPERTSDLQTKQNRDLQDKTGGRHGGDKWPLAGITAQYERVGSKCSLPLLRYGFVVHSEVHTNAGY
jgi:hypothetical protein